MAPPASADVAWEPQPARTCGGQALHPPPRGTRSAAIARLRRDAQAAGARAHPNIAAALGFGDHAGRAVGLAGHGVRPGGAWPRSSAAGRRC